MDTHSYQHKAARALVQLDVQLQRRAFCSLTRCWSPFTSQSSYDEELEATPWAGHAEVRL